MRVAQYIPLSEDDFLALEAASPLRHEYVAGEVYAMTGASLRHNIIAGNLFALLRPHLRGTPCRAFIADAKLRIAKAVVYRSIPALEEYVLVAQDEARIEINRRHDDVGWEIVTLTPGDPVELKSLDFVSDFPAIYEETGLLVGGISAA